MIELRKTHEVFAGGELETIIMNMFLASPALMVGNAL